MFGEDFVLSELQMFPFINPAKGVNVFRFETNEAVNEYIRLEQIRLTREDTRFDEEIERSDNIMGIEANINSVIANLGQLAEAAVNIARAEINFDPNAPLELLKNIFENIVLGWKQTLVTAFQDRSLRMDVFKNMIMKYEMDNCRNQNLFNALINSNGENRRLLEQVWEIGISSFNGTEE
jgi:hypothetical protein